MFTTIKIPALQERLEKIHNALAAHAIASVHCIKMVAIKKQIGQLEVYADGELNVDDVLLLNIQRVENSLTTLLYLEGMKFYDQFVKELSSIDDYLTDIEADLPTLDSLPDYNEMLDEQDRNQREHQAHEASRRL